MVFSRWQVKRKSLGSHSENCVSLAIDPSPLSNNELLDLNESVHKLWDLDTLGIRSYDADNDVHQRVIN